MSGDTELDLLRQSVNCAAVLERMIGGWTLDARESSRRALKYRRGPGEIIIINHEGRGWWDPTGPAKGDVFRLVQHLDPSLNFSQVCKMLRGFVGMAPTAQTVLRHRSGAKVTRTPAERWAVRAAMRAGDAAWTYLAGPRALPPAVLIAAAQQDCVRLGLMAARGLPIAGRAQSPTLKSAARRSKDLCVAAARPCFALGAPMRQSGA